MRLTLRTLLAWLDDKLPPGEVREIGKQVSESSYAKELVERIHKVTRQRRLTVPPSVGPDALDPNLVASYIDNELDPDQVAELEKKCLTSDVHLAEVSSVHQILSLIGQKARVPTEVRLRMYQLVKGREALRPRGDAGPARVEYQPVTQPVQPWVTPPPPPRPLLQRFGPAALVVGLMGLLSWSAWLSLQPPDTSHTYRLPPQLGGPSTKEALARAEPTSPPAPAPAEPTPEAGNAGAPAPAEPAPPKADEAPAKAVGADIPAGAVGLAKKPAGLLLRYDGATREWARLAEATGLKEQERLLLLDPYRASLELGTAAVDMARESEVGVRATSKDQAARFALIQGRVVLHGNAEGLPFAVEWGDQSLSIAVPPNVVVGVERLHRRPAGSAEASPAALRVWATEGPIRVSRGESTLQLDAPGSVVVEADGKIGSPSSDPVPDWVSESTPSAFDQKLGDEFLKFFGNDRPIVTNLVEASEDDRPDICRLAIAGLRAVGDISLVVPVLNHKGSPTAASQRRAAIGVLRAFLEQGPESAKALHEQLQREFGEERAATAEKLLVGYSAKEAADAMVQAGLVELLGNTEAGDVGIRELALDNLRQITGRDTLDYDPEKPEGKGLDAWVELLRKGELKPVGAATKPR